MALNFITVPSVLPGHYLKKGKTESTVELNEFESEHVDLAKSRPSGRRWRKVLEIFLLLCIILAVCALFVTPTILYALPPSSLVQAVGQE